MGELLDPGGVGVITVRSLLISGAATVLAVLVGVPAGYVIARRSFRGRTLLLGFINTGMGMPPVVVGLVVWLLLTRSGPLGDWGLIYTREAMVVAQFVIATPLVVSVHSIVGLDFAVREGNRTIGAGTIRALRFEDPLNR
mgnify:CR=1 FL=1